MADSSLSQSGLIYPSLLPDEGLLYAATVSETAGGLVVQQERQQRVILNNAEERLAFPALSPDGKRVAITATYQRNQDIWIYDLQRDTPERLTFDSHPEYFPVWAPNGRWVAFQSYRTSNSDIYIRVSDGSGAGQMLVGGPGADRPPSFYIKANHPIRQSPNHPIRQSSNHHFYRSSL